MITEIELTMKEQIRFGVDQGFVKRTVRGIVHCISIDDEPYATGYITVDRVKIPLETTDIISDGSVDSRAIWEVSS